MKKLKVAVIVESIAIILLFLSVFITNSEIFKSDAELIKYEEESQNLDIEEYIENPLIFGDFHIEFGHTLDEYMGLYGDQYNDGELWDFCLIDIWDKDKSVDANPNMRYWAIVDENEELRVFETYDFEEFEGEE